jgi:sirohydrochlorin ferrochelatase
LVPVTLLVAAHGTKSAEGLATTTDLVSAVAAERPDVPVELCFLDVAEPSLTAALDGLGDAEVVVVPLLLSAGYHVQTDIPAVVAGRPGVRVAGHLGPDPAMIAAVADRLAEVDDCTAATTVLAAIGSSRPSAQDEVAVAAAALASRLGRPVSVLPLDAGTRTAIAGLAAPVAVASYLLAPGGFLDVLREAVGGRGRVAAPIGVHPALVRLVWERYDGVVRTNGGREQVR